MEIMETPYEDKNDLNEKKQEVYKGLENYKRLVELSNLIEKLGENLSYDDNEGYHISISSKNWDYGITIEKGKDWEISKLSILPGEELNEVYIRANDWEKELLHPDDIADILKTVEQRLDEYEKFKKEKERKRIIYIKGLAVNDLKQEVDNNEVA